MMALSTRQRDMLSLLLSSQTPLVAADIADRMHLTPRQVSYSLKAVEEWLHARDVALKVTPGVGFELRASKRAISGLAKELAAVGMQLVLSAGQRQQCLALHLLSNNEPEILYQLQQKAQVSRTTILKDLSHIDEWLAPSALTLQRRPNYGIWIEGAEAEKRKWLAALLWGDHPFGEPITEMTHTDGLIFHLSEDAHLLPLVNAIRTMIPQWEVKRALGQVAFAELRLGGRFMDDAVLQFSLVLAIQLRRLEQARFVEVDPTLIDGLRPLQIWTVASRIFKHICPPAQKGHFQAADEIATIAMHLLSSSRNGRWPSDFEVDNEFITLIDELIHHASEVYQLPHLLDDTALRDGLMCHVVPATLCQRFDLWSPAPRHTATLGPKYTLEQKLARELSKKIEAQTGTVLPESEINNIALLLRAAFIREGPHQLNDVIIVCPSGMATAQLLVARIKARFPRLGTLNVVSLRELTPEKAAAAQLIITTVRLPTNLYKAGSVIQVHPLLLPEDVEAITQWLA